MTRTRQEWADRNENLLKESWAEIKASWAEIERVEAINADLLAALKGCIVSIGRMPRTKEAEDIQAECGMLSAIAKARAAISKAIGETP